jgi:hypothetical protein
MNSLRRCVLMLLAATPLSAAEPPKLTFEDADARLRRAYALARESNDRHLSDRALEIRDAVKRALDRKDLTAAELLIRDAEKLVGFDPGGRTMFGLPVAQVTPDGQKKLEALNERLTAAMAKEDREGVDMAIAAMVLVLGEDVGVPDLRRKGDTDKPIPVKPADVADIFLKMIESDSRALKVLSAGVPAAETMPRAYASIVQGCVIIRPLVERHHKARLANLDALVRGCCKSMLALQVEPGHFKFPDLRGKHARYGDLIDRAVDRDVNAMDGNWVVLALPEGASQVDAAECGLALLRAGAAYKNDEWTKAGRKAADWAMGAACVPDFVANACSVSLLCEAHRVNSEKKYLDAAWKKARIGLLPGQATNGRWLDAHSGRTMNHIVLLRALHDLEETLPKGEDRNTVAAAADKAVKAILDEAAKLGAPVTSHTVQELARHRRLRDRTAVNGVLEQAASAAVQKCTRDGRVRVAVPLPELAAVSGVFP